MRNPASQTMIRALSVSVSENLLPLSQHLWARRIPHRISENGTEQVVWVARKVDVAVVTSAYGQWCNGTLEIPSSVFDLPVREGPDAQADSLTSISQVPVTAILIMLSILVTWGLHGHYGEWFYVYLKTQPLPWVFESRQLWRLFTPVFLHFGILHLVFNMLMLWVFGRQLEIRDSRWTFLALVLIFGIISNLTQYLASGPDFGGMSGVVYGVIAYCWTSNYIGRQPLFNLPNALMGIMLGWLLLGFTNLLGWVGLGNMANAAHLSGLMAGMIAAWLNCQLNKSGQT